MISRGTWLCRVPVIKANEIRIQQSQTLEKKTKKKWRTRSKPMQVYPPCPYTQPRELVGEKKTKTKKQNKREKTPGRKPNENAVNAMKHLSRKEIKGRDRK